MTTGVVIVTYNSEKTIGACIDSVLTAGVADIVVVDSNSMDSTVRSIQGGQVKIMTLSENKGFAFAANAGANVLNTNYVLFLNPDARLQDGAISSMVQVMENSKKVGVVGGMLVNEEGVAQEYVFGEHVTPLTMITRRLATPRHFVRPRSVGWVSGGALLMRREVFRKVGCFDEGFFLYWEDIDICRRVKTAGFDVYIDPNAIVFHDRGSSSDDPYKKTALYDASANRYFQKYYPPLLCHLYRISRIVYRLFRPLAL